MESPTPTPTPRKPRRHNRGSQRPEQRDTVPALQPDNGNDDDESSEDELIVLLRASQHELITSGSGLFDLPDQPKKGGILPITRADIVESTKGRRGGKKVVNDVELERKSSQTDRKTPRKRGAKKAHPVEKGFDITESVADTASESAGTPTRRTRGSKPQAVPRSSGLASSLATHNSKRSSTKVDNSELVNLGIKAKPYDMTLLSQSLPDQHDNVFGGQERQTIGSKRDEESDVWDMPMKTANEQPNVSRPGSIITSCLMTPC